MNQLSWLIWLSEITGALKNISIFLSVLCGVGAIVITFILISGPLTSGIVPLPHELKHEKSFRNVRKGLLITMIAAGVIAVFVPSGNAVKLIAASEFGGRILTNPTASKAEKALDKWLSEYIAK